MKRRHRSTAFLHSLRRLLYWSKRVDIDDRTIMDRSTDVGACICCKQAIETEHNFVRVAVPSKALKRMGASARKSLACAWNEHLVPHFHESCWEKVEKEANSKAKKGVQRSLSTADIAMISEVEETAEFFETLTSIKEKAYQIAKLMKESKHTIVFSGAGISASAGIPTYRGIDGIDVIAQLGGKVGSDGAGAEVSENSRKSGSSTSNSKKRKKNEDDPSIQASEDYLKLKPSQAHQLVSKWLLTDKLVHYVISQNCDDLHLRSGVPPEQMSELHGNVFIEFCEECRKEYRRPYCVDLFSTDCHQEDWYVKCRTCGLNHYTGRTCSSGRCRGRLRDTIVNFGDDLHDSVLGGLARAESECRRAAVALCIGSSLTVTPASELPTMLPAGGAIVVVNLQRTALDGQAAVRVWGEADHVLAAVEAALLSAGGGGEGGRGGKGEEGMGGAAAEAAGAGAAAADV